MWYKVTKEAEKGLEIAHKPKVQPREVWQKLAKEVTDVPLVTYLELLRLRFYPDERKLNCDDGLLVHMNKNDVQKEVLNRVQYMNLMGGMKTDTKLAFIALVKYHYQVPLELPLTQRERLTVLNYFYEL